MSYFFRFRKKRKRRKERKLIVSRFRNLSDYRASYFFRFRKNTKKAKRAKNKIFVNFDILVIFRDEYFYFRDSESIRKGRKIKFSGISVF